MPEALTTVAIAKNTSYVFTFWFSFEYLGFDPEALTILSLLMLLDICTAVTRVWLNEGGQQIKSAVLKKGIAAKLLLLTGLFAVALCSKSLGFDIQNFAQAVVSVITLGELYSVLGNIHSARTGQVKVEFDAVAWMLSKVKDILTNITK